MPLFMKYYIIHFLKINFQNKFPEQAFFISLSSIPLFFTPPSIVSSEAEDKLLMYSIIAFPLYSLPPFLFAFLYFLTCSVLFLFLFCFQNQNGMVHYLSKIMTGYSNWTYAFLSYSINIIEDNLLSFGVYKSTRNIFLKNFNLKLKSKSKLNLLT